VPIERWVLALSAGGERGDVATCEIEPRAEDAKRSLAEVPGLLTRAPDDIAAAAAEQVQDQPETQQSRSRFRLFGR